MEGKCQKSILKNGLKPRAATVSGHSDSGKEKRGKLKHLGLAIPENTVIIVHVVSCLCRPSDGRKEKKMKNGNQSYRVDSRRAAWRLIDSLFEGDYTYDVDQSHVTGYPIYLGTLGGYIIVLKPSTEGFLF